MDGCFVEDFFGSPIVICTRQYERCEYQFSAGDGAMLACKDNVLIEIKGCPKYKDEGRLQSTSETVGENSGAI